MIRHGQKRTSGTMMKLMNLILGILLFSIAGGGGVQGGSDDGYSADGITIAGMEISGKVEGGYVELMDIRELYNPGATTAVSYLFSLGPGTNVTELDISSEDIDYAYQENQGEAKSGQEVLDGGEIAFISYLDAREAEEYMKGLVNRYSDPALFSFSGNKLLLLQFPLFSHRFVTISLRYSFPVSEDGGLQMLEIPMGSCSVLDGSGEGSSQSREQTGSVFVDIRSMSPSTLEGVYSPSHEIDVLKNGLNSVSVSWTGTFSIGDSMTIYYNELSTAFGAGFLNYRMDQRTMYQENEDGYFMFLFNPNTDEFSEQVMPKDVVFIIDTSGSMRGDKIIQARHALNEVLDILSPEDKFTIIHFSNSHSRFNEEMVPASSENIEEGKSWVDGLTADGGTDINSALLSGLDTLSSFMESGRPREIIFLTDGEATSGVTNTDNILENVENKNIVLEVGATLHVFGIGYNVNTNLLDSLASGSSGASVYITPEEDIDEVLTPFYQTIASPVLTDITMEIDGIEIISGFPESIPDLYKGGELNVVGSYKLLPDDHSDNEGGEGSDDPESGEGSNGSDSSEKIRIYINGTTTTGNTSYEFTFDMEEPGKHDFLPRIYATRVVGSLLRDIKLNGETTEKIELVKRYGKRYGIETPYNTISIHTNSDFDSEGFRTLTGEASVQASQLISSYSSTKIAGMGLAGNARMVGDRTFLDLNGVYIESSLLPDEQVIQLDNISLEEWINENIPIDRFVKFGSSDYFSMASGSELRDILSVGTEIVFRNGEETVGVTRGNLLLYIKNLKAVTWEENLCITWETDVPSTSVVHYREAGGNGTGAWKILRHMGLKSHHNMTLSVPYEKYEFFIESADESGNTAVKDNNGEYYLSHHFPLSIISVKANIGYAIMAGKEVIIRWYTNVPADGQLFMRVDGGEWELANETSDTKEHEARFTGALGPDGQVTVYEFYVTASLGSYHVVEDNDGNYFSFDLVNTANSTPSFGIGYGMMILSIMVVVALSKMMEIAGIRKGGEQEKGSKLRSETNSGVASGRPTTTKRMIGIFGTHGHVEISKNGAGRERGRGKE